MDRGTEAPPLSLSGGRSGALGERLVALVLASCAGVTTVVTLGIAATLLSETAVFFSQVSLTEFLTEVRWTPLFREKHFGILPLLSASIMITVGAGLLAVPLGLLTSVFTSEYAGSRLRSVLKPTLEILACVPTVVYGYLAVTLVTPALRVLFPDMGVFNALSAAVVVGIMILPMVASLSDDALRSVPEGMRRAAFGLGATRAEVITRVVIPSARSGILAAFLLALARALGETMVVSLAAGNSPRLTLNPLESVQTMTSYVFQVGTGDTSPGTLEYRTMFVVGMVLFLMTLLMSLLGQWLRSRGRKVGV